MEAGRNDVTSLKGKWWAVPRAVNCWPFHVRQDLLDKAGLTFPKNWEEFRAQGRQLTKAPLYYYGMTLGKINDTNNHVTAMAWTYGGKLQNEDGSWAVKAGDKAWLDTLGLIQAMYVDDKIIPPGAINWDDGANNMAYQSEQLVITSNPTSIYNWLQQNKPELAKGTKFYAYPAGPAGSVGQVDVWSLGLFKNGKATENAKHVLAGTIELKWYNDYINNQLKGRFVPVYQDMIKHDMWKDPLYDQYVNIIQNGRIMSHAATPQTATAEVTTTFIIGDMMQDLLVKKREAGSRRWRPLPRPARRSTPSRRTAEPSKSPQAAYREEGRATAPPRPAEHRARPNMIETRVRLGVDQAKGIDATLVDAPANGY